MTAARLDLRADLAEIARLNEWLSVQFSTAKLGADVAADMKLCLNEAVANIISYGELGDRAFTCGLEVSADHAKAVLDDPGIAFDPLARADAVAMDGLETARIGGFGIRLIKETASALAYEYANGRNLFTIVCGQPK